MARSKTSLRCVGAVCLLFAALMLNSAVAESKCDPSSTNCAGPLKEAGVAQTAATSTKVKAHLKYEDRYEPEGYDYADKKWKQEGGLEGAPVHGWLQFNAQYPDKYGEGSNYFDPEEGYVPEGYGNSHKSPSCEITNYGKEFAYEGNSNLFTVDIDCNGVIILEDHVKLSGNNNEMNIVLKSAAFEGYTLSGPEGEDGFEGHAIATLSGGTLTIAVSAISGLQKGQKLQTMWKLNVPACIAEGAPFSCCKDGQYRHKGHVCRASVDLCDAEECCTGEDAECPNDLKKPEGYVCRHPKTFCDVVDKCDGENDACVNEHKPAGTHCPWARDCLGCNTTSPLTYTRTGPKPYGKGSYKGGDGYGYGGYGIPKAKWPVCVGKCESDECILNPPSEAPHCCREDEEAYEFEEEHGYGGYDGEEYHEEYHPDTTIEEPDLKKAQQPAAGAAPKLPATGAPNMPNTAAPNMPNFAAPKMPAPKAPSRLDTPVGIAGLSMGGRHHHAPRRFDGPPHVGIAGIAVGGRAKLGYKGYSKYGKYGKKHGYTKDDSYESDSEDYKYAKPDTRYAYEGKAPYYGAPKKDYYADDSKQWFSGSDPAAAKAPGAPYEPKYAPGYEPKGDSYDKYAPKGDSYDKYEKYDDKYGKDSYDHHDDSHYKKEGYGGYEGYGEEDSDMPISCWS